MAGSKFLLLTVTSLLLCILSSDVGVVRAQRRFSEEMDDGLDQSNAKLAMNRATSGAGSIEEPERIAVRHKKVPLLDTFRGTTSQVVGDGVWKERGMVSIGYDGEDQIVSVTVDNNAAGEYLEDLFTKMCDEGALYQL